MQTSDPDARLMLAFAAGDDAALSDLYHRWAGPLVRFLEKMVKERATAEELMQETFIRVHGAKDRYEAGARFSTWLFRIARNLALNEIDRARNKNPHLSTDVDVSDSGAAAGPALTLASKDPDAETVIDARRAHARLEVALAELPERQRSALWLAAVEGHSYDEIAEILETSTSSVKALVHRARRNLASGTGREPTAGADAAPTRPASVTAIQGREAEKAKEAGR